LICIYQKTTKPNHPNSSQGKMKRSFSTATETFGFDELKRQCFEIQKGVKREREDEDEEETVVVKKQQTLTLQSGHKIKLSQLQEENIRLRNEMSEKNQLIQYGSDEIRRLNADILTLKHQLRMMEEYVNVMEGQNNEYPFYVS